MLIVPVQPKPSQTLTTVLGGQNCRINLYQKTTGLYFDLFVDDTAILTCVSCLFNVKIVRAAYLKFAGDFVFTDTLGTNDPEYSGLNSRYFLFYLDETDLA